MLFDRGSELPQATIRSAPRAWGDLLAGDLKRWLTTKWRWLRPRMVPVTVAFLGMLGMLEAVNYLSHPSELDAAARNVARDATPYVDGQPTGGHYVRLVGSD